MRFFLTVFCLFIFSDAFANEQKLFNAQSFTLNNGMEVVVIPNHRAPVVTHMVWYKVGAADEPQGDGVSGAAHFLEHLMFKGTHAIPAGELSKIIRNVGGNDNAFTSWDYTAYFQTIPKNYLPLVMALEADRMININPAPNDVASEHQVIIEERRQRTDNDPKALFMEQMRAALYNTSPYGIPIIGWKNEMPKLDWTQPQAYYQKWYVPNNAILVVSGDVTIETLKPLAEKYFGILPSKKIPEHIRAPLPEFSAPTRLDFKDPSVQQPTYLRASIVPSVMTNASESYAIEILENVLSSSSASRLYQDLVVKEKIASDIDFYYDGDQRGDGNIWITAIPSDGVTLETLEDHINKAFVSYLTTQPLTDDEINAAKKRLIDQAIFARDSIAGPAMIVGQKLATGLTLDQIENWPNLIQNISPDTVRAVLKTYLDPSQPKHSFIRGFMTVGDKK